MLKKIPFHIFLITAYPVIYLLSINVNELSWKDSIVPLAVVISFSTLIWVALCMLTKEFFKSAIATSLVSVFSFSFLYFFQILINTVSAKFIQLLPIIRVRYILPICLIFLMVIIYLIAKSKFDSQKVNQILNITSLVLIIGPSLVITKSEIDKEILKIQRPPLQVERQEIERAQRRKNKPDIYYIILDRYANGQILKEFFDYDNTKFLKHLEEKGFYIASNSKGNYPRTYLSLASSLNADYLQEIINPKIQNKLGYWYNSELISTSNVCKLLKEIGYKIINITASSCNTKSLKIADHNFYNFNPFNFSNKLLLTVISSSVLGPFVSNTLFQGGSWNDTEFQFNKLYQLTEEIKGPKFVYAHILLPHDPYVYDSHCNYIQKQSDKIEEKVYYKQQLDCTNIKVSKLINHIIKKSKIKPVIIIQSDEGPFVFKGFHVLGEYNPDQIDWNVLPKSLLRVHLRILNAYYLPNIKQACLYDSISPVNTFRVVLNQYFDFNFKLLKDKVYILKESLETPYSFIEVKEEL